MASGTFREDLFYRLAVGIIKIPALRERQGDLSLLADNLLKKINEESSKEQPGYKFKKISPGAKNIILQHTWQGNVRELYNTLQRAAIWSDGDVIDDEVIKNSLLNVGTINSNENNILDRPIDQNFDLGNILNEVERHYIERALAETHGNKTRAALKLGFTSHQTMSNRMKRGGIK